ncbi:unnamed protein product [Clonostachys chloroleuca]|uniref:Uncharacterized protein n=1 Tax=Clonostachys chloroleuca TaxID=1926264 RepID=A0AA35M4L3_9HYPO|nr:unnamed protein product [Clonostachys chloroleuca]
MPPFLDSTSQSLAANPGRLDRTRRRFDRDEPPASCSSTDSNYEPDDDPEPMPDLQEIAAALEAPLNEADLRSVVSHMQEQGFTRPGRIYVKEARLETTRLISFIYTGPCNPNTKRYLIGEKALERHAVIVRHYIKKRWQRLGIWDSSWGIPGRVQTHCEDCVRVRTLRSTILTEPEPVDRSGIPDKDNEELWRLKDLPEYMPSDPSDPVRQAVELRRYLRRGEPMPLPPRDNLTSCASPKELEDFLVSRPFFLFELEYGEEIQRKWRVPHRKLVPVIKWNIFDTVVNRWKERGNWNEEWAKRDYRGNCFIGWKWPHESDVPEAIDYSELNSRDDIDFTPSEIDALEAIEARRPIPPTSRAAQETRYKNLKSTPPLRRSARIAKIEAKKALASFGTFLSSVQVVRSSQR